jgi:hypothetical protein
MRILRYALVTAALLLAVAAPAQASQGGVYLRTGDVVCTDQSYSNGGARYWTTVVNGAGVLTLRVAATAGGAETVIRSATGTAADWTVSGYSGYFRGCVTITTHTISTWVKHFIYGTGAGTVNDIGPNTASLSPGAWSCGDWGYGPVTLTGSAGATVTWYIAAFDQDYAWVGSVFSVTGPSVNTTFTPDPSLSTLELCVLNSSSGPVSASFELANV